MLVFDGHLDLAMNALLYERDQTWSVAALREREANLSGDDPGTCTVTLPELRRGGVAVVTATLIARAQPEVATADRTMLRNDLSYPTVPIAHAAACAQLAYYELLERQGHIVILGSSEELESHWQRWQATDTREIEPIGVILTMESADPITSSGELVWWHQRGLRSLMLAHFRQGQHAYGTPSSSDDPPKQGPLTDAGRALLDAMAELDMPLDLTHLCDESFDEAASRFEGRVYASHSNCRTLCPGMRQLSDDQLRFILQRDGVVGLALHNPMIAIGDGRGSLAHEQFGLERLVDHVDYICQLAGDAAHVAIGSDLDGGFGVEWTPREIDTIADLARVADPLAARGYRDEDIAAVLGANWLRFWLSAM